MDFSRISRIPQRVRLGRLGQNWQRDLDLGKDVCSRVYSRPLAGRTQVIVWAV